MKKRVLFFNFCIIIISYILISRGLYFIENSGRIALEIYGGEYISFLSRFYDLMGSYENIIKHYIYVVIIKGIIFSLCGLFGFVLSFHNLNKEFSKK